MLIGRNNFYTNRNNQGTFRKMASNIDEARKLADQFKREGYLDKLKQEILSKEWDQNNSNKTVEQIIRTKVSTVVKNMVNEDENLIFKNRGSTSALIEAQLFKEGYKKLTDNDDGIKLDEYMHSTLHDPMLIEQIEKNLELMLEDSKKE